jgi:hypothetical protein
MREKIERVSFFYDGEGEHKHKLFLGLFCLLTCSSKKYTDPANGRRNNFIKMTHPLIAIPEADVMNIKCLPDSVLLMAHSAINKPFFFFVAFSLPEFLAGPPQFLTRAD